MICSKNYSSSLFFAPKIKDALGRWVPPWESDLLSLGQTCREGKRGSGRRRPHKGVRSALELPLCGPLFFRGLSHSYWAAPNPQIPCMALKQGETQWPATSFIRSAPKKNEKGGKIARHTSAQENAYLLPGTSNGLPLHLTPMRNTNLSASLGGLHGCFGAGTDL